MATTTPLKTKILHLAPIGHKKLGIRYISYEIYTKNTGHPAVDDLVIFVCTSHHSASAARTVYAFRRSRPNSHLSVPRGFVNYVSFVPHRRAADPRGSINRRLGRACGCNRGIVFVASQFRPIPRSIRDMAGGFLATRHQHSIYRRIRGTNTERMIIYLYTRDTLRIQFRPGLSRPASDRFYFFARFRCPRV